MPWVPLDDNFHCHRKVVTAGLEAVGLHARALSWCGANLTDGHVPAVVVREMAGGHARQLTQRLVGAGLWEDAPDGWHIHGWTERNPSATSVRARRDAANTRRRRWRTQAQSEHAESAQPPSEQSAKSAEPAQSAKSAGPAQSGLTATEGNAPRDASRDASRDAAGTRLETPRPSPSPSPPLDKSRPPLSLGTAHAGREDQELPGQTLFSAVRAARERARLDASKWHDSALESALASAAKAHAERTRPELESALLAIASWPDTKAPSRLRHVVEKACREATQSNGQRRVASAPPLPPTVAELRAQGALGNA